MDSSTEGPPAPLLSVGMPVYNGERYLRDSIESILAQDCALELVISDNASTDATEAICRGYADAAPERVRYVRYEENRGAAWNFNNAYRLSRGRYFKWAAYDDTIAPGFCAACIDELETNPDVVLAYTRARIIDADGNFVEEQSDRLHLHDPHPHVRFEQYFAAYDGHNTCNPVFGVFRSDALARTRLIGNFLTSDRILLGEIALHGKITEIPEALFSYRWHPHNSMDGLSDAERMLWFDPDNDGRLCLLHWRWVRNWSDAITRAPMTTGDRWRCRARLLQWGLEHANVLSKELVKGALWPILKNTSRYRDRTGGF